MREENIQVKLITIFLLSLFHVKLITTIFFTFPFQVPLGLLESWREAKKREREETVESKRKKMKTM